MLNAKQSSKFSNNYKYCSSFYQPVSHIGSEVGATVRLNAAAVNVLPPWLESEPFPVQLPVPVLSVLSGPVQA